MATIRQPEFMRQYLLGQLLPQIRKDFEKRYLADKELFEKLVEEENDLVSSYVRGELVGADCRNFENKYLSVPERFARVKLARALSTYSPLRTLSAADHLIASRQRPNSERRPAAAFWKPLFLLPFGAAVGVAVAATFVWMLTANWKLHRQLERQQVEERKLQQKQHELQEHLSNLNPQPGQKQGSEGSQVTQAHPDSGTIPLTLTADFTREMGEQTQLSAPPGGAWVRVRLILERDKYSSYTVSLESADGVEQRRWTNLRSISEHSRLMIALKLQSKMLTRGDYSFILKGVAEGAEEELVATYPFVVATQ